MKDESYTRPTPSHDLVPVFSSCVNKVEHFIYITGFWGLDGGDGTTLSEVHLTGKLVRVSCFNWFWKISQLSYFQYTDHLSLLVSLPCAWSHLDQVLSFTEFISVSSYQGHFNNTILLSQFKFWIVGENLICSMYEICFKLSCWQL